MTTYTNRITRLTLISVCASMLCLVGTLRAQPQPNKLTVEQEFIAAVTNGEREKVVEFLKKNPSLAHASDRNGVTAILLAAYHRRKEVLEALLATNVELNIFEAAATGQTNRVATLVSNNRNEANSFARDGFTPLGLAAFFGRAETVVALLAGGANVNLRSNNAFKAVPLQSAAVMNQLEIARLLLDHGADPKLRGEGGYTPLHEVSASGRLDFAKLLLDRGADVNAKGDDGKTPLTIALEGKKTEMANFLRSRGGCQ